jgi:IS5 family transposase
LEPALEQVYRGAGYRPAVAICDRGFRGQSHCWKTEVVKPRRGKKNASVYEKRKARMRFRRRVAIEPRIGYLKSDFRLDRNFLKGQVGDAINLLLAAVASNLSLWIRPVLLRLVSALRIFQKKWQGAHYPLPA